MFRVEDKYLCTEIQMFLLERRIEAMLSADSNQLQNGYCITSVYFDDSSNSCFYDSQAGHYIRQKYRIRIYNVNYDLIKLEVKCKKNNRVKKNSKIITYDQMRMLMSGNEIEDSDPMTDSPITMFNMAIAQRNLRPKVIVEYDRNAYVYPPGNVRITFDRNVRAGWDMNRFLQKREQNYHYLEEGRIVEVKYDELLPGFIERMLETGNMQQISFSKYCLCREKGGCYR